MVTTKLIVVKDGAESKLDDQINRYLRNNLTRRIDLVDIKYAVGTCGQHRAEASNCQIYGIDRSALVILNDRRF